MVKGRTAVPLILGAAAIAALLIPSRGSAQSLTVTAVPGEKLSPEEFTKAFYPFAKSNEITTGVPALVTIAQAALESGWGEHAPGFNFFGIKPGKSWQGATQKLKTWECGKTGDPKKDNIKDEVIRIYGPNDPAGNAACRSGRMYSYRTWSAFRAYDNPGQSFYDHGKFLRENSRYAKAFTKNTAEDFIREVATAGYAATTPGYADTVIKIMKTVKGYVDKNQLAGVIAGCRFIPNDEKICRSFFPVSA